MAALSQLSYGPRGGQCSAELILLGPVDSALLIVLGGREAKLNSATSRKKRDGKEIALSHVWTVGGKSIDLVLRVRLAHEAGGAAPSAEAGDDDHVTATHSPLALNAEELSCHLED